jgi:hypothetical protein
MKTIKIKQKCARPGKVFEKDEVADVHDDVADQLIGYGLADEVQSDSTSAPATQAAGEPAPASATATAEASAHPTPPPAPAAATGATAPTAPVGEASATPAVAAVGEAQSAATPTASEPSPDSPGDGRRARIRPGRPE